MKEFIVVKYVNKITFSLNYQPQTNYMSRSFEASRSYRNRIARVASINVSVVSFWKQNLDINSESNDDTNIHKMTQWKVGALQEVFEQIIRANSILPRRVSSKQMLEVGRNRRKRERKRSWRRHWYPLTISVFLSQCERHKGTVYILRW